MKNFWTIVAVAAGGLMIVLAINQTPAFFALDASSRASWVQAIGTIIAIAASSGVAIWIDQGTARRIATERALRAAALRSQALAAIATGGAAMASIRRKLEQENVTWNELEDQLIAGRATSAALKVLLRREIPTELIFALSSARKIIDRYLTKFAPDAESFQIALSGRLFFSDKAALIQLAQQSEDDLMAIAVVHHG